jgi:hypothetical protein
MSVAPLSVFLRGAVMAMREFKNAVAMFMMIYIINFYCWGREFVESGTQANRQRDKGGGGGWGARVQYTRGQFTRGVMQVEADGKRLRQLPAKGVLFLEATTRTDGRISCGSRARQRSPRLPPPRPRRHRASSTSCCFPTTRRWTVRATSTDTR